jgi:hypothetical protein
MGMAEELLKSILDPASSGLDPPPDTAVGRGLAGYTGKIINLMRVKVFVNIGNPGHFPLPGMIVSKKFSSLKKIIRHCSQEIAQLKNISSRKRKIFSYNLMLLTNLC